MWSNPYEAMVTGYMWSNPYAENETNRRPNLGRLTLELVWVSRQSNVGIDVSRCQLYDH